MLVAQSAKSSLISAFPKRCHQRAAYPPSDLAFDHENDLSVQGQNSWCLRVFWMSEEVQTYSSGWPLAIRMKAS